MSQVFEQNGTTNFPAGEVEILINGSSKGKVTVNNQTLGQMIRAQAKTYGLRTFSVYVDGRKADTSDSAIDQLCKANQIDLVAKDARGHLLEHSIWTIDIDTTEFTA